MTAFTQDHHGAVLDLTTAHLSNELAEVEGRLEVLRGLLDALARVDEVHQTVQFSMSREAALEALRHEPFRYSTLQAEAVLNLPIGAQTADDVQRLRQEYDQLSAKRANMRQHVTEVLSLHWFG